MTGLILIFIFVILMAIPGFYLITRAIFPKRSKRSARIVSYLLTALLVFVMATVMFSKL